MKVELISYTPDALTLLLRTKNTRLKYEDDPANWIEEKRREHLAYMLTTIKSSFEMVEFVWHLSGITRALANEIVRTRTGSYAQQSQRAVDVESAEVKAPDGLNEKQKITFRHAVTLAKATYRDMLDAGIALGEARGILPLFIHTAIDVKWNLRTLHETAKVRLCTRATKEYQDTLRAMRAEVLKVYPWLDLFIQPQCAATGTCAFPRYGRESCPIWSSTLDREEIKETMRSKFWSADRHAATPRAVEGMSRG